MEIHHKIWLAGLGFLLFIGLIILLVNLGSHSYYQEQHYNNLPSVTNAYETPKPTPIQHYEDMRDESVELTELNNIVEKTPANGTIDLLGCFNDNRMLIFNKQDNSLDILAVMILLLPIFFFRINFRSRYF